ncbi:MAG: AbrB family transcriptional regulator [Clostridia bacterium]|nr:AbrB family transcriptional regulator [Clostridia bacterium]
MWIFLVLAIAATGGIIGLKLKLPAGAMLGAMISVAIFTVVTDLQVIPPWFKVCAQMVSGGYIGTTMTRESLGQLKKVAPAAVFLLTGMLVINLTVAGVLYMTSPLDLTTCLFATAPGGMTDMTIISDDMGANSPVVSVFQVCRMALAISSFPIMIPKLCGLEYGGRKKKAAKKKDPLTREQYMALFKTIAVAVVSGLLGYKSGLPGGTMLFSVVGVSICKLVFGIGFIPLRVKQAAQIISGSFIGAKITMATVTLIASMWYNVILMLVIFFPMCLGLGWLLHKVCKLDLLTGLYCSAPAGASEMALIASDVGADGPNVAILQIWRMLGVIAFFPSIFKLILSAIA